METKEFQIREPVARPEFERQELTESEKRHIDSAFLMIKENYFAFEDEEIKNRADAQQEILKLGNRVLPYLSSKTIGNSRDFYIYSRFADALSEEDDLELLLSNLETPNVRREPDGSSISHLYRSLYRIICEIRTKNPQDPRLSDISQRLASVASDWEIKNSNSVQNYKILINLTGEEMAQKLGLDDYAANYRDINYAKTFLSPREHFDTWEEVQQQREAAKNAALGSSLDDFDRSYYDDLDSGDIDRTPEFPVDYEDRQIAARAEKLLPAGFEPTAVEAAKLYLYNVISRHPDVTDEELSKKVKYRLQSFSQVEKAAQAETNPLPTIGIELEIPYSAIQGKVDLLKTLNIPNYSEGDDLREVNPSFSYSARTQARIIQELAKMNAVPLERVKGKQRVPNWSSLSLHVNLGLPENIRSFNLTETELYALSDTVTYAFSSPARLKSRKTDTSLNWNKSADRSKKTGNIEVPNAAEPLRLEIRATEFKDYPTFRMLIEVQRLGAMLNAHIKRSSKQQMSETDNQLAELWQSFQEETIYYHRRLGLEADEVDLDTAKVVNALHSTDLKQKSRQIITDYSKKVSIILKSAESSELKKVAA